MKESNVRVYSRIYKDVFDRAKGSIVYSGYKEFIDFFAGAGALNYGHNNDFIKERVLSYIERDGIMHGLDFHTVAKKEWMACFHERILKPRSMNYTVQFCGPTGTNGVEAAIKLARRAKKRTGIFAFMGGFHGMTLGSLTVTGSRRIRKAAGVPLHDVTFIPYFNSKYNTIEYMESILDDSHSGIDIPAALIMETVQAEGGVNVAAEKELKDLMEFCRRYDIIMICDDIQVGCGRCGDFFSFERAGVRPDMVVLSKSLSGYGFPMSVLLMNPRFDKWGPGDHTGTFRGFQLAFIGATAALEYRDECNLEEKVKERSEYMSNFVKSISRKHDLPVRGIGMIWGLDFANSKLPLSSVERIIQDCYEGGLIIESAGRHGTVLKLLPPLNIEMEYLQKGCKIIESVIDGLFRIC
jgi:diaminobutyrate-2-oxoglutarate transaminase